MMSNTILAFLFSRLKRVEKQENKSFELIEEITIDSNDVTAIERTQEPDGTAYSFEEVLVNFEMEASATSASDFPPPAAPPYKASYSGLFWNSSCRFCGFHTIIFYLLSPVTAPIRLPL
jgi:hypothetical protein